MDDARPLSTPSQRYLPNPPIIDLEALGVPVCRNMVQYVRVKRHCFYDVYEEWDDKEELKKASRWLLEECPTAEICQRLERPGTQQATDILEMALRYVHEIRISTSVICTNRTRRDLSRRIGTLLGARLRMTRQALLRHCALLAL